MGASLEAGRWLLSRRSPSGAGGRLQILIFHRVLARPDPLFPDDLAADDFDLICTRARRLHNVLALDEAVRRLRDGKLPERAAAITFDDGYADNHDVAMPILARHGLPATFFIATGYLGSGVMWNDWIIEAVRRTARASVQLADVAPGPAEALALGTPSERRHAIRRAIGRAKYLEPLQRQEFVRAFAAVLGAEDPPQLMMSPAQVRQMRMGGMQIGAHTVSHPILLGRDASTVRDEIVGSRDALQALLDEPVRLFAYPNGKAGVDFGPDTTELVRQAGFEAAVTTEPGVADVHTDLMQLPRFSPWERDELRFTWRLVQNVGRSGPRRA